MTKLLTVLALAGCADKANPVLPSSFNPNPSSTASGPGGDAGASSTGDDASASLLPDALPSVAVACDLLAQICPDTQQACYPVSGSGKCLPLSSALPAQANCIEPNDCNRGLACVSVPTMGSVCLPLCDVLNPTAVCGGTSACQPLASPRNVGYCL